MATTTMSLGSASASKHKLKVPDPPHMLSPLGPSYDPRYSPAVGSWEGGVSNE